MKLFNRALAAVAALVVGASPAFAQLAAIDVSDIETSFSNQVTPMTAVLVAVLTLAVLVAAFRWIKRTVGG